MNAAYRQTPPNEVENRAWVLTQIGHLQLITGRVNTAEPLLQQALGLFPGYHYALSNLAKVRSNRPRRKRLPAHSLLATFGPAGAK